MYTEKLIAFNVKGNDNKHLYIKVLSNDKLLSWEEIQKDDLRIKTIEPKEVEGGQDTLKFLGAWEHLTSDAIQTIITGHNPSQIVTEISGVKRGRGRPRKNLVIVPITPTIPVIEVTVPNDHAAPVLVKRGRGRPRKNPVTVPVSPITPAIEVVVNPNAPISPILVKRGRGRPRKNPVISPVIA